MDRHARQMKVTGIGPAGQARLARASVEVRLRGLAADVATRYLAGAGVGRLLVPEESLAATARSIDPLVRVELGSTADDDRADGYDLRDPSARAVARGARAALLALSASVRGAA